MRLELMYGESPPRPDPLDELNFTIILTSCSTAIPHVIIIAPSYLIYRSNLSENCGPDGSRTRVHSK